MSQPLVEGVRCGHYRGIKPDDRQPGGCGELAVFKDAHPCPICHRFFHDECYELHRAAFDVGAATATSS